MKHLSLDNTKALITILFIIFSLSACYEESDDLNNLNDTIYVRHKKADMPAFIHGNASDKVFLIILHGGPGGNGLTYRSNTIKSDIEKNNAVVYFDQRGSGGSQGSYSAEDVDIDLMAEDVLALTDIIKAKYGQDSRLFLMGHSWGGTLGPATLLKGQSQFKGWIDVSGAHEPVGMYPSYKTTLRDVANEHIALGNSVEHWKSMLTLINDVGDGYSIGDFRKLNQAAHNSENILAADSIIYNKYDGELNQNPLKLIWNGFLIQKLLNDNTGLFGKVSYTDRLKEITIPSLVLWGKYDLIVPTVFAQEAYDNLGSTAKNIFIFEKSGHSPMFSEPTLFAEKVIEFINKYK